MASCSDITGNAYPYAVCTPPFPLIAVLTVTLYNTPGTTITPHLYGSHVGVGDRVFCTKAKHTTTNPNMRAVQVGCDCCPRDVVQWTMSIAISEERSVHKA